MKRRKKLLKLQEKHETSQTKRGPSAPVTSILCAATMQVKFMYRQDEYICESPYLNFFSYI